MNHQLKLFQDTMPDDSVLYIIGNGFDLAHGIKSSYSDFREWLVRNENKIVEMMDIFFSNQRDIWSGIEQALGEYDEESILDYCRPDEEFDYEHSLSASARVEDSPMTIFQPVMDEFREAYHNWVNSIEINGIEKIYNLNPESLFFTFNYTDTLETEYGINKNQVTHIHGSRLNDDEYIIGHNNYRDQYSENIANYSSFFCSLENIKQIVVIGHSMSKVDWPYFEEIKKNIDKDVPWLVYCHNMDDRINTDNFKFSFKLSSVIIKDK